jgi:membrane dipeptidase
MRCDVVSAPAPLPSRSCGGEGSQQCYGIGRGHVAYYHGLQRLGIVRIIRNCADLEEVCSLWESPTEQTPFGLLVTMESSDPIMDPDHVFDWYETGLRMASLSHYGKGAYSHGTGTQGGLLPRAKEILRAFRETAIIVDLTHLTDEAFWQVLEAYSGPVVASHHNCRALVPGQRQLSDEMIKAIVERNGVMGVALDLWMLDPKWNHSKPACEQQSTATLEAVADHIDHISQLAGSCRHVGIGSDLDGGFGVEQSPADVDTIADLQKLEPLLEKRGYSEEDVKNVFSENWLRLLRENLG